MKLVLLGIIIAILETTIFFNGIKIVEKLYPAGKSGDFLNEEMRDNLIQAIGSLAHDRFHDDIHGAKIGNYMVSMISRDISMLGNEEIKKPIFLYSISDIDTDVAQLVKKMKEALDVFLNPLPSPQCAILPPISDFANNRI